MTHWPDINSLDVSAHQRERIAAALARRWGILAGRPGTGKTFSTAAIIKALLTRWKADDIAVAAPTGKAAVRITESLQAAGVNIQAKTVHSLLGVQSADGGGWAFEHGERKPLPQQFVFVDECFPPGTFIDTPSGPIAIEQIRPGSRILNAFGIDTVVAISRKVVNRAIKITCGEASFICSENHPIFTSRGYICAQHIGPGDSLVQTTACMRLLRNEDHSEENDRFGVEAFLYSQLQHEMVDAIPRIQKEDSQREDLEEMRCRQKTFSSVGQPGSHHSDRKDSCSQSYAKCFNAQKNFAETQIDWSQAEDSRREWYGFNETSTLVAQGSRQKVETRIRNENEGLGWSTASLQDRFGESGSSGCNRVRWNLPYWSVEKASRQEEGCFSPFNRVDSVEVLQPGNPELDRFRDANGQLYFYDLQATRHPSFSVCGFLVHNCSMLDTNLAASLLAAIGPHTHLLLIGDTNQLAPVGHGAPLRDLIEAGLPCGELTEIRRNSGRIVRTCSEIVDARRFTPSPRLDLPEENLLHVEMDGADAQIRVLEGFLDGMRQAGNYDATWDVQVLCAVNKKSPLARKTLNKRLQALLNPEGLTAGKSPFRVGDKVVNLKNSWFKSVLPESDPVNADGRVYCANGEFGEIVSVEPNKLIVRLQAPSRTILVPRGTQRDDADDGDEAEGDAESNGQTATNTGCSFELAYACSVHKFQGSQVPIAIIMADSYPGAARVQSRNWIYTALSRAEKYCVVIGKKSVVDAMVGRDGLRRVTFLPELIGEERARIQRVRAAEAVHQWSDAEWEQVLEGIT